MCKNFLTTKISLGSSPNMPHFVQPSFETLLKHPTHAVTFDVHIFKSTAYSHQTRIYSEWSASTHTLTHTVFTIPTNVTRKLTRSGCTTFCCTNCLCPCPHFTWDHGSPRDHNLSISWWTLHKYPSLSWIFSTKTMIGPATASYDLFMNTSALFQVPYNTARCILFLLICHILSGIQAVEELWLLAMLLNTLQVSSMLLCVVYMSMSLLPTRKSNSKPLWFSWFISMLALELLVYNCIEIWALDNMWIFQEWCLHIAFVGQFPFFWD